MDFFTSDLHLDHRNVIKYCDRPFAAWDGCLVKPSELQVEIQDPHQPRSLDRAQLDVDAMNREIVARWNARVGPRDRVFCLGDFHLGQKSRIKDFRKKLNGHIILVLGNHDRSAQSMYDAGFDEVHRELYIPAPDDVTSNIIHDIYLHHQPMPHKHWGDSADLHLCGHVHESWRRKGNTINVGVDVWDFKPVTLQELLEAPWDSDALSAEDLGT